MQRSIVTRHHCSMPASSIVEGRYRPRPRLGRDEPASQAFQLNMGVGSQIRPKRTAEHLGQGVIQAYTPWLVHVRSRAVVS
jgi:hypothetical protein